MSKNRRSPVSNCIPAVKVNFPCEPCGFFFVFLVLKKTRIQSCLKIYMTSIIIGIRKSTTNR
jgi:hypothetical protein